SKFRVSLYRRFGCAIKYVAVVEHHKSGIAHLHILLANYIEQAWISEAWSALGGGRVCHIKLVDVHRISRYLSKYLTKEMLMYAPHRSRRVTVSRSLKLFEKAPGDPEVAWHFNML